LQRPVDNRRGEMGASPIRERLTARVMLDDHVRVDDAPSP